MENETWDVKCTNHDCRYGPYNTCHYRGPHRSVDEPCSYEFCPIKGLELGEHLKRVREILAESFHDYIDADAKIEEIRCNLRRFIQELVAEGENQRGP